MMTNEEVHFGLKFKHYCISVDLKYVKKRRIFKNYESTKSVHTWLSFQNVFIQFVLAGQLIISWYAVSIRHQK